MEELYLSSEFQTITIDCTVKVALTTMGQTGKAQLQRDTTAAAYAEWEHRRRVLTVRGRTGAVVLMASIREEAVDDMAPVFKAVWPEKYLHQVEFIGSDKPSHAMLGRFSKICPMLKCLYLDTLHVAMRYESAFARCSSAGSKELRRIMLKFVAPPSSSDANASWLQSPFKGKNAIPPNSN